MGKAKKDLSFLYLNLAQFFGALNDNTFKALAIFFLIKTYGNESSDYMTAIVGFVFVLPFLLFSHFAGVIADRINKNKIIVFTKILEILIMLLGAIAFALRSTVLLFSTVFLMSLQSALFSPSKYGIIPELVNKEYLSKANSILVGFTYLAVIIGTALAPLFSKISNENYIFASIGCIIIAMIGCFFSMKIKKTPSAGSRKKYKVFFLKDILKTLIKIYKNDKYLFLAVIGSAYFMLVGAFIQLNLISYGIKILNISKESSSLLFLIAAVGIGLGSLFAGKLSGRNIEFGIVPLGAIGITIACFFLGINNISIFQASILILFIGFSAGLFLIPLDAYIQYKAKPKERGEVIAASNFLGFVGVLLASLLLFFLSKIIHINPAKSFFFTGYLNMLLTIFALIVLPDFFIRFIVLIITKTFYKITIKGIENVPTEGPALLVSNHVSWVDALLLIATNQRRIRFVMDRSIYSFKPLKPFFDLLKIIPISFNDPPKKLLKSIESARKALDDGYLVCIFAEGYITRTGHMQEFRKGFEKIIKGRDYPIIPVCISGIWGSIFSYYYGKLLSKLPQSIPYPVTILFGKPMPSTSSALEIQLAVMELMYESFEMKKNKRHSLFYEFSKVSKKYWFSNAIADSMGQKFTYGKLLTAVILIADKLKPFFHKSQNAGIILPSSSFGVIANLSLLSLGKTVVNLNFTAGEKHISSAIEQAEIDKIITSKKFLNRIKNFPKEHEGKLIYFEDIARQITKKDKLLSLLKAIFIPSRFLDKNPLYCADKTSAIIFSSGSTGTPKGVELTHHNIISNVESIRMVLRLKPDDSLMAILPFFHSFGFTATIFFPLLSGFSVFYHPNPLEASKIIKYIREKKLTILLATPTFLLSYMKKATKEDFKTLRIVIVGAEKLSTTLAEAFYEKFKVEILEGYGTTELSPIASVNVPDIIFGKKRFKGKKEGSVGRPIPGVCTKIINPETGQIQTYGKSGLLFVKGPNVMKGYFKAPEKTKEVLSNGWYNTGDLASIDKDGFIWITGRLSRFSKIGGEMVPHEAIEEVLFKEFGTEEKIFAVTSVADKKKGEKLVLLYNKNKCDLDKILKIIENSKLPNLWKPKKENIIPIDEIPILGSGKLNLSKIKKIAEEKLLSNN